jgi:predicted PurR-regulated permease PerM
MQMPIPKLKSSAAANALVGLWTLSLTAFIIAALYVASDLLIPVALAAVLTLSAGTDRQAAGAMAGTHWGGPGHGMLIVAATGAAGWVLTRQLVDLATHLPDYKGNIQTKLRSFKLPSGKGNRVKH